MGRQPDNLVQKTQRTQVVHRQVDSHLQQQSGFLPELRLGERTGQHRTGQVVDQAVRLRHADELIGKHDPIPGVMPAHQRFHAHHMTGIRPHLRLIIIDQLAIGDGCAQLVCAINFILRAGLAPQWCGPFPDQIVQSLR
jgi:hypothetical protein